MASNPKTFPQGGVHPQDNKLSANSAISSISLPDTVAIPLSQHIGAPAIPVVQPNDPVKIGQLVAKSAGFISTNIHSPFSGTILKFDRVTDITGYKRDAIIIKVEGDVWLEGIDISPEIKKEITFTPDEIRQKVLDAGIVGLGGATFPSHVKLSVPPGKTVEYLCINGAECEPYLTSDHRLMLEKGEEILIGIKIALKALGIHKAFIGIEDNKMDAVKNLQKLNPDPNAIEIIPLKTHYPQGGERQLVKALTGREIPPPPKGLPIDAACVVFNVGTMFAIYEAIQKNKPLVERVVTVTGKSMQSPGNYLVRFGIPISFLIEKTGGLPDDTGKVILGGPMMGRSVADLEIPVTKGTSGILVVPAAESTRNDVQNCIRCGKCVSLCPLGLEPYLLMSLTEKANYTRAEVEKILNCCECGCCSYICPSKRPLLDYIKFGKSTVLKSKAAKSKNE